VSLYELHGVGYEYQGEGVTFRALTGIDLHIEAGEFVAIVGASGSGKTTMMNLLGLLSSPTEGRFLFRGDDVGARDETDKAALRNETIGFVFQHFALLPRLSVLDNILLPYRFSERVDGRALEARARLLLARMGLSDKEDRMPAELSGGQKQRVAICRALLMEPVVLLADEPTGALDSRTSAEVLALFDELHAAGQTILVITHDPDVAAHARRQIVLRDGKVVEDFLNPVRQLTSASVVSASRVEAQPPSTPIASPSRADFFADSLRRRAKFLQNALASLTSHKLRSALTGLGLMIGVTSILVIVGLGEVVQHVFDSLFYNAGTSKIYIWFDSEASAPKGVRHWRGFDMRREFPAFAAPFSKYGRFRPFLWTRGCNVQSTSKPARAQLSSMYDVDEFTELDAPLTKGRFPTALEIQSGANVVVLGSDTVDALFAKDDPARSNADFPLGEILTVNGCEVLLNAKVVGLLGKKDTVFSGDANDRLYLPTNTMLKSMGPRSVSFFSILPNRDVDPRWLADNVTNYLTTRAGENHVFGSGVPAEIIEKIRGFLLIIQALTGFIGGLCIVVGGIGIFNIMIVTVTERVREIGILKSQGAKPRHVRNQFLAESVVLCLLAGVAGVAVGLVITNGLALGLSLYQPTLGGYRFVFAPLGCAIGLAVSFACGVGFGYLPALRAARMEPAACMREE